MTLKRRTIFSKKNFQRFFDILGNVFFALLIIVLAIGMISGGLKMISSDFVKYIITISFVLAGFTFYAVFNNREYKNYYWIIMSCRAFILAGFFLLAYLIIPNIGATESKFLSLLKFLSPIYFIFGLVSFAVGMSILVISLEMIVTKMNKDN